MMSFRVPEDGVLVADGGLATELEARGNDLSGPLWSARLLADAPEQVTDAHLAFFRAGAMIATSASYQASFEGFARGGADRRETARLIRRSVELAQAARDAIAGDGRTRWVAASVGPYGAALADGSEYRGRYGLSVRELTAWHRPRLETLAEAGPDGLALETVPDTDEAEALMTAISGLGIPAWLSYNIAGERTRAGQPLADAFAIAASVPEVVAAGVNCCAPADVPAAIVAARLAHSAEKLRVDHALLEAEIDGLVTVCVLVPDAAAVSVVRGQALDVLRHISEHRHLGVEIVHEAYSVDIEAAD